MLIESLVKKTEKVAVIGLGYVGLPIALAFAKKISVIGFDINSERIELLQQKIDPSNQLSSNDFESTDIFFTESIDDLRKAKCYIVAVPTPVDEHHVPDLSALLKASETVGKVIKKGDLVIFESTVYPGCTEEDCIPVIEKISGLQVEADFNVGYSPERINPGDSEHTFENVIKIVSANNDITLQIVAQLYALVVTAGVHQVSSIKVAEAAKIIENTQRDLNIALVNELSIIFDKMHINTYEVLEAAGTKWNFLKFQPGLVGGHCIGVDPYYLTYKAAELGYISKIITAGRFINDSMGGYVAKKVFQQIIVHLTNIREAKVLVMGATFKENVADIRNSKVADVVKGLQSYQLNVDVVDVHAKSNELMQEYGFSLAQKLENDYDAVIIVVPHKEYTILNDAYFASITKPNAVIADIKGIYRGKIKSRNYWSL